MKILIKNAIIINEGEQIKGSVLVENEYISTLFAEGEILPNEANIEVIDAEGMWLLPGVIDDQVHFREPGLTHKGDIHSESRAAVAGGVTSFMEMPNTNPQATTIELLEEKYALAAEKSMANYSFYLGATNDNIEELLRVDPKNVCGIKVFMGSSTGNMLVNDPEALRRIFSESPTLVATHCEDETIIQKNMEHYRAIYTEEMGYDVHPLIRSEEACYSSSSFAVQLAKKYNTRLHVLHISTAKELQLFENNLPLKEKRITAEVCVHHLCFSDNDYKKQGARVKWNPAIKKEADRIALLLGLQEGRLDVVATDHAPHTLEEKSGGYFDTPSGGPLVQHSLLAMLQFAREGVLEPEQVVEKMCHAPADLFRIDRRGYIRPGYFADLVLVHPNRPYRVHQGNIYYKCGWSPFEGTQFDATIVRTWVNGTQVYHLGRFNESVRGKRLQFNPV